ncbi:MAG: hypothetical protein KY454_06415 [Actinobacteria bacterium]|nr:hypothetical protein [Actinomycetota bacterium]MBW3650383.1 hypothetical protein [Actinomycetota bacterium]
MERLATVRWRTPPPTSVDEELAVYDDGTAWLVVRRGATDTAAIGTFVTDVSAQERDALATGNWTIDLLHPPTAEPEAGVTRVASEIGQRCRSTPRAVARFYARGAPGTGAGSSTVVLAVVGEGAAPVVLELDPAAMVAHFSGGGSLSWVEVPEPSTGFVTPDAQGLGGLYGRAAVAPGQMGALKVAVEPPAGTDEVSVQVSGWLVEALPDAPERQRFEARTEPAPLG